MDIARVWLRCAWLSLVSLLIASPVSAANLSAGDEKISDETEANDWLAYGRTHNERRFSPLRDIHDANVAGLKPAWFLDLPQDVGLTSTPLVIDGTLYFVGSMGRVRAVEAATGRLLWEFDPDIATEIAGRRQVGMMHNRGISFSKGRIFTATWDGRLIALDARNGRVLWSSRIFPKGEALYITGAPKAFKDKVIIGNGGTETGPTRGYVVAFDAETGREAWKFFIVPGNPADGFEDETMAMAAKTWTGEWWKHGGGGNVWHGFTYDAELDTVYVGTGNGAPWNQKVRSPGGGDNLFLCSIVALNPDTGKYKWHYQTNPGETWDYNSNMDIVLADLAIGGRRPVKAILHAPKNGFFYVIDRTNGKLISAEPFVKTTWASKIDIETGRPVEIRGARYETGMADVFPGTLGAHNWHGMSYSPASGLAYIPTDHRGTRFDDRSVDLGTFQGKPFEGRPTAVNGTDLQPTDPAQSQGSLQAWDPVNQKQVWSVPLKNGWNSGTLSTAGNLVFHGRATGELVAHEARTGKELWRFDAGLGISAPPITYKVGDTQYIAVLVGFGGAGGGGRGVELGWQYGVHTRRLIAFSLKGRATVPKQLPPSFPVPLTPADFTVKEAWAAEGARIYLNCSSCHGGNAIAAAMAPDLRASPIFLDQGALAQVVRDGSRVPRGMPAFPEYTDEQLRALTHFVRKMAADAKR
jgi:quinohemoprotein ethanol dehydrogenase